jgi:hypothetical protein
VLVLAAGANCVVQSMATLLRSFKSEAFSGAVAGGGRAHSVAGRMLTAPRWGNAGVTFSYLTATAGIALPSALTIFTHARRRYLTISPLTVSGGEAG